MGAKDIHPFSLVSEDYQVLLPSEIRTALRLKPEDVIVYLQKDGEIVLKKGKVNVEVVQ